MKLRSTPRLFAAALRTNIPILLSLFLLTACSNEPGKPGDEAPEKIPARRVTFKEPAKYSYHLEPVGRWVSRAGMLKDTAGNLIVLAVNRTDSSNLRNIDSVLVPDDLSGDVAAYMQFPDDVKAFRKIDKIVFFSYPTQSFGAYENGYLVQSGPTNMGRKKDPTPTGLFFSNWKAEQTTSTFNDEWDLKWNFNIESTLGVGWHQYALPGYPASHSCLRLQTDDAKQLYKWADQWKLRGADSILANGTPTMVFGSYPFGGPKPWLQLLQDGKALNISASDLEALVRPNLERIMEEQQKTRNLRK